MAKNRLLLISLITILFIAVFHFFALKSGWYWVYRWLDIPVHILGGFWVSLTALWLSLKIKHIEKISDYRKKAFLVMLASVLIVGILWEVFEIVFKITSSDTNIYWSDTIGDIMNGFVGGVISYFYFTQNKKCNLPIEKIKIQHEK